MRTFHYVRTLTSLVSIVNRDIDLSSIYVYITVTHAFYYTCTLTSLGYVTIMHTFHYVRTLTSLVSIVNTDIDLSSIYVYYIVC